MCIHLFSPGIELHVDFASETVVFEGGRRRSVFDLLLTNHSRLPIRQLHVILPHVISLHDKKGQSYFREVTSSLARPEDPLNRFYVGPVSLAVSEHPLGHQITLTRPAPDGDKRYVGLALRDQTSIFPFRLNSGYSMTEIGWALLSQPEIGFSPLTVELTVPMESGIARWFRFEAATQLEPQNRYSSFERFLRRYAGILRDRFDIAGPENVRRRTTSTLGEMRPPEGPPVLESELRTLKAALFDGALKATGTRTVVQEWHLNAFFRGYRMVEEPTYRGSLLPVGGLLNHLAASSSLGLGIEEVYQWVGGRRIGQNDDGLFDVRFFAHDIPVFALVSPYVALIVGLVGILLALLK